MALDRPMAEETLGTFDGTRAEVAHLAEHLDRTWLS